MSPLQCLKCVCRMCPALCPGALQGGGNPWTNPRSQLRGGILSLSEPQFPFLLSRGITVLYKELGDLGLVTPR